MTSEHWWEPVVDLPAGNHLHLDDLASDPPPPGSKAWLPYLMQVVDALVGYGGRWIVKLPVGFVATPPVEFDSSEGVFEIVGTGDVLMEPPSVTRLGQVAVRATWEGEHFRFQWYDPRGVMTAISISRSSREKADQEPYSYSLVYEIG